MAGKMAAAESKHDNVLCDETIKSSGPPIVSHREIECYRFRTLDLLYYIFSVSFFIADIATDSIVFVEYFIEGHLVWACFAMSFTILPACIIQLFSLRWHHSDGSLKSIHWILHFMFLGVLHRHLVLLHTAVYSLRSKQFVKDKNWVYRQKSDICMLHLFESFMGAAPQLILQLYIMAILHYAPLWTSISAVASLCSLSWAIGTYLKAMHKINPDQNNTTWVVLTLQSLWRGGMLTSRIALLVLTAVCLRKWFLLFLGLHWLFMTIWVILQNTDFCPTVCEERIYNCIIGLIYCFDFFNLRTGKSRYRVLIFYMIIVIQNLVFLIVYMIYFKDTKKTDMLVIAPVIVVGGMLVGLTSMTLYYGKFHPSKIAGLHKNGNRNSEVVPTNKIDTPRSFKQYYRGSLVSLPHSMERSQRTTSEEVTADKQFLLTNIVQVSDCIEEGVVNQTCQIETESKPAVCIISECESQHPHFSKDDETASTSQTSTEIIVNNVYTKSKAVLKIEDLEVKEDCTDGKDIETIHRQKRRAICLPVAHGLDIDKDIISKDANVCLPAQKRRGICSSVQLILETDAEEKLHSDCQKWKASSDKLETDDNILPTDSSLGEINKVLDSIKNRERLKTPSIPDNDKLSDIDKLSKDLQQKDDTMSCVTSIHDYENVCPLGVARPPWCIRSWKGYTDIETYIHDDSVVRDRRRDTLTSTTTGTTYSSEFSDTTCASSLIRGVLKQDDYLDTLAYDLVDPRELRTLYNDESFSTRSSSNADEQNATLYIAKPVVIDDKGGMFALDTIFEERDDSLPPGDAKFECTESSSNSVSTLVNTIDQIRKYATDNSPRHVYRPLESQWDYLDSKNIINKAHLTKVLFEKDFNDAEGFNKNPLHQSTYVVGEKCEIETIRELVRCCTVEPIKKTPLIDAVLSDSPILGNRTKLQKQLTIAEIKDDEVSNENDLYVEMSSLVPGKNNQKNVESDLSCSANVKTKSEDSTKSSPSKIPPQSSSHSLSTVENETPNEKRKKTINYPKRKFSLLKERFEPKSQRLVYVVTPNSAMTVDQRAISSDSEGIKKKSSDLTNTYDKENLVPVTPAKISHSSHTAGKTYVNPEKGDKVDENGKSRCNVNFNLKERRHMFLEQVLSPPKLLSWNKRRSFNPSTKNL